MGDLLIWVFDCMCLWAAAANCLLRGIISRQWFSLPFLPPIFLTAWIQALGLVGCFSPYSLVMSFSWFIRYVVLALDYSNSNLIYDIRRFTMRFPLHRLRHLFGATTTFCSSRPTFGFVFLSLSSLRYCLGISSKHGNLAFGLTMSISSGTLAKWNLTETSPAILRHVTLWLFWGGPVQHRYMGGQTV